MGGVVTSFFEKQRHRQLDFERKTLQELSFNTIEKGINQYFDEFLKPMAAYRQALEDMCVDFAIEAFLLGASYGKFGYYGETLDQVHARSEERAKVLTDDLHEYWQFWCHSDDLTLESIYVACEGFIYYWWKEGFQHTIRRSRLRLH